MSTWKSYVTSNFEAMEAIDETLISNFFGVLDEVRRDGGKVWVLGNGGSASLASHAVGDFCKTSKSAGAKPLFTIAPSEMTALQTAYANDESYSTAYSSTLSDFGGPNDAVWIISVSGKSPNLIAAYEMARKKRMRVISTVGRPGFSLASDCDVGIVVQSDDYQIVENVQVTLMHWFTKLLARNP